MYTWREKATSVLMEYNEITILQQQKWFHEDKFRRMRNRAQAPTENQALKRHTLLGRLNLMRTDEEKTFHILRVKPKIVTETFYTVNA
jgi:hypothetical protein